jgi:beta-barrel assembly-enhancing protease
LRALPDYVIIEPATSAFVAGCKKGCPMKIRSATGVLKRFGRVLLAVLLAGQALTPAFADGKGKPPAEDPEVKLGRENAAQNDADVKLITEPAIVERVNRIGQEIAAIANTLEVPAHWGSSEVKKFVYTFKVVDDKDVNAYSLPGGFIYVNKGLLDYVHSDDELAGVLAHEVAHASHHHMMELIRKQNKLQQWLLPLVVAGALASKGGESVPKFLLAGQFYMVAKLNSYGVEAEKDADRTGLRYLQRTRYSPVGLLTFMERLARDETLGPEQELGIYRTHPPSPERAKAALVELDALKIAVNRRDVDPTIRAAVTTTTVNGTTVAEVKMFKTVVARLAATDGMTADERGKKLSSDLNRLFDQGLKLYEVRLSADKSRIIARTQTLLAFTEEDAAAHSSTVQKLTADAFEAVKSLLWQDQVNRPTGG